MGRVLVTKPILWNHTIWVKSPLPRHSLKLWHASWKKLGITSVQYWTFSLFFLYFLVWPWDMSNPSLSNKNEGTKMKMVTLNMRQCINLASHKRLKFNDCGSPKFTKLSMQAMAISKQSHTASTPSILVVNWVSSCLSFFLNASTAATYIFYYS